MKTLVVYANPSQDGHCSYLFSQVIENLKQKNREYTLVNLYETKFQPLLYANELYTQGGTSVGEDVLSLQKEITSSKHLIFVYPVWWNTMPAILKGFFDRVFSAKFAFVYTRKRQIGPITIRLPIALPVGLLKNEALVFVTSGATWWQSALVLGNRFAKIISHDILGFCGIKTKVFQIGGCNGKPTDAKKAEITRVVRRKIAQFM
jgi:NAD(P)H dehydrogenase (quinone)